MFWDRIFNRDSQNHTFLPMPFKQKPCHGNACVKFHRESRSHAGQVPSDAGRISSVSNSTGAEFFADKVCGFNTA